MISKKIPFVLLILVFSCLLWPASSHAQTPINVIIIYPAAEPQEDGGVALSVFFTITDETNRPIPQPGIDSVEIELLGGDNVPISASFEDAKTPFYIAMVLDASGSMANLMPGVREAAQAAVDEPPPGAHIAVIKFNELSIDGGLSVIEPFTVDMALVQGSINAVESEPNAPTCLYNALYKSIELLDETTQQPQERQAIILFTDGKDERADGSPCSQRVYDDVINRATRDLPITPIHTIGLCSEAQCSNINKAELNAMAKETFAFSATGSPDNMGQVFQEIMEGLSSQLVARANVCPKKGEIQAVLRVKLRDNQGELVGPFSFFSDRDCNPPPPPIAAQITSLVYDKEKDVYNVAMSVTSPEIIHKVVVEVWDEKSGTQLPPPQEFENPGTALQFERHTDDLTAGREYSFRLKAVDQEGNFIPKPAEEGNIGEEGNTILSQQVFVYEPPPPPPPEIIIKSVQADFDKKRLFVDLDIRNAGEITSYEGFIVDKETGAGVYEFGPTLFPGNRIEEKLPEAIEQAGESRSYIINLVLTPKDGSSIKLKDPYEFRTVPPPPLGFLASIWLALQNPVILISVFVIILCVTGLVFYWNRPTKKESLLAPMPRPPIDHTMISGPSVSADAPQPRQPPPRSPQPQPPRLRIEVLETPERPQEMKKLVTNFPCVIGRKGGDFNIPGDQHISGRHIEISVRDNKFFITDLESRNGTFIGETRLSPGTATMLNGSTIVWLGRRTRVKLEPQA